VDFFAFVLVQSTSLSSYRASSYFVLGVGVSIVSVPSELLFSSSVMKDDKLLEKSLSLICFHCVFRI
jgi:hypothetical protein